MRARTPRATPMPMPAFAPLLRLVLVCGVIDLPVAVAGSALAGPDDGEEVGGDVVTGVDSDVEVDDEVVAAAADADHVVAERKDLQLSFKSAIYLVETVSCLQKFGIL